MWEAPYLLIKSVLTLNKHSKCEKGENESTLISSNPMEVTGPTVIRKIVASLFFFVLHLLA